MSDPFTLDNWMSRFVMEHSSIPSARKLSTLPSLEPVLPDSDMAQVPLTLNGHSRGLSTESTDETASPSTHWGVLSTLLNDRSMTSDAVVNNALDWLLE